MENWKAIPGYEGYYEVSDCGNVRSMDRTITRMSRWGTMVDYALPGKPVALAKAEPTKNYFRLTAGLSKDGKNATRLVHHLVMLAFVGPMPKGMEVAHNDGNPMNNNLSNLRYATPRENSGDKIYHNTLLRGEKVGTSKLTEAEVRYIIDMKGKCTLIDLANQFGVRESTISRIQNGHRWRHLHA